MSSNLPPGVTERMLPGNTPEDEASEKFFDDFYNKADAAGIDLPEAWDNDGVLTSAIELARGMGYEAGRAEALAEAKMGVAPEDDDSFDEGYEVGREVALAAPSPALRALRGLMSEYRHGAGAAAIAAIGEATRRVEAAEANDASR